MMSRPLMSLPLSRTRGAPAMSLTRRAELLRAGCRPRAGALRGATSPAAG